MTTSEQGYVPEWTLGERMAKARREASVGRQEMADEIGVGVRTLERYESDVTKPKDGLLKTWALRCGVHYHWLRFGTPRYRRDDAASTSTSTEWNMRSSRYASMAA